MKGRETYQEWKGDGTTGPTDVRKTGLRYEQLYDDKADKLDATDKIFEKWNILKLKKDEM